MEGPRRGLLRGMKKIGKCNFAKALCKTLEKKNTRKEKFFFFLAEVEKEGHFAPLPSFFFSLFNPFSPRFLRRGPSKWCVFPSLGIACISIAPCDSRWATRRASFWANASPESMQEIDRERERRSVAALFSLSLSLSLAAVDVRSLVSLGQRSARSPRLFLAFSNRREGSRG